MDQGEGKADGQTGESLGRPDLRLHDLRHSGAVLAALTGATLAADGLPGSLPPRRQRCAISTPPRSATRSSRRRAPGWPGASSAAREIAHHWSFSPTSAIDLAPARSPDSCRPVHRLRAEPSAIDLRRRAAPPIPVGQSPPRLHVWPLSARIAGDAAPRLSDRLGVATASARDQIARTALRDHRGDRLDPRDTGTRRGQTAPQRLSEPRAPLGWSGGGMGRIRRSAVACAQPSPRVGGLVARKPIARRHCWEAVHLRRRRPRSPLAQRNRDHKKGTPA